MSPETRTTDELDAREQVLRAVVFLKRSRRFWWVTALTMLLGGAACAIVLLFVRQPDYRSETVVLYTQGLKPTQQQGPPTLDPRSAATRLREMLLSRSRLQKLIDEYGLYQDEVQDQGYVKAIEEFREDIEFSAPSTDTFTIAYRGKSPEQAKQVTEHLAKSLMVSDGTLRKNQARLTRDFLEKEKARTERALRAKEKELAEFLANNPGFALDSALVSGAPSSGAAVRAAEADRGSQNAAEASTETRTRWVTVPVGGDSDSPSTGATASKPAGPDPQLLAKKQSAERALSAAQSNLADKRAQFTDAHPDVRSALANVARARAQLQMLERSLQASSGHSPSAGPNPYAKSTEKQRTKMVRRVVRVPTKGKKKSEEELIQQEKETEKELVRLETEWTRLMRSVSESRTRYHKIESAYFDADVMSSSEDTGHGFQMQVIDPAFLPTRPVPPGQLTLLAAALLASMMLGLMITGGLTAIDDRIYDARDAAEFGPVLAEVPKMAKKKWRRHNG